MNIPGRIRSRLARFPHLRRLLLGAAFLPFAGGLGLAALIAVQAHANQELYVNQAAETLRKVFGQNNVSRMEYVVFTAAHRLRMLCHPGSGRLNRQVAEQIAKPILEARAAAGSSDRPAPIEPLIESPSLKGEGQWLPLAAKAPGLWRTRIRPNCKEPLESVDLVAIDMQSLQLNFVPGVEMTHDRARSRIPAADRDTVVAVFNGGFRTHHTGTGQRKAGILYRRLESGKGSIVMDRYRGAIVCDWDDADNALFPGDDVRQNLPILLHNGQARHPLLGLLGKRHLNYPTWRTGLGQTAERRWLIFAAGDHLRSQDLALALRLASCREAVHLDQNHGNVYFDLIRTQKSGPQFAGLEPTLHLFRSRKVLTGSDRDFFYITPRPAAALLTARS